MTRRRVRAAEHAQRPPTEDEGQIAVLVLGLFVLVAVLVAGAVDVTAAQLARIRMLDAADASALAAANALDEEHAYAHGVGETVALTDSSARETAAAHLGRIPLPNRVDGWGLAEGTGSPDGATAVVVLRGHVTLPMSGWVLDSLGDGVTIAVESRARAPLG